MRGILFCIIVIVTAGSNARSQNINGQYNTHGRIGRNGDLSKVTRILRQNANDPQKTLSPKPGQKQTDISNVLLQDSLLKSSKFNISRNSTDNSTAKDTQLWEEVLQDPMKKNTRKASVISTLLTNKNAKTRTPSNGLRTSKDVSSDKLLRVSTVGSKRTANTEFLKTNPAQTILVQANARLHNTVKRPTELGSSTGILSTLKNYPSDFLYTVVKLAHHFQKNGIKTAASLNQLSNKEAEAVELAKLRIENAKLKFALQHNAVKPVSAVEAKARFIKTVKRPDVSNNGRFSYKHNTVDKYSPVIFLSKTKNGVKQQSLAEKSQAALQKTKYTTNIPILQRKSTISKPGEQFGSKNLNIQYGKVPRKNILIKLKPGTKMNLQEFLHKKFPMKRSQVDEIYRSRNFPIILQMLKNSKTSLNSNLLPREKQYSETKYILKPSKGIHTHNINSRTQQHYQNQKALIQSNVDKRIPVLNKVNDVSESSTLNRGNFNPSEQITNIINNIEPNNEIIQVDSLYNKQMIKHTKSNTQLPTKAYMKTNIVVNESPVVTINKTVHSNFHSNPSERSSSSFKSLDTNSGDILGTQHKQHEPHYEANFNVDNKIGQDIKMDMKQSTAYLTANKQKHVIKPVLEESKVFKLDRNSKSNTETQPKSAMQENELNKITTAKDIAHKSLISNNELQIQTSSHLQLNAEKQQKTEKPLPKLSEITTTKDKTHTSLNSNNELQITTSLHTQLNSELQQHVAKPSPELNKITTTIDISHEKVTKNNELSIQTPLHTQLNTDIQQKAAKPLSALNKITTTKVYNLISSTSNNEFPIKTSSNTQFNREIQQNAAKTVTKLNEITTMKDIAQKQLHSNNDLPIKTSLHMQLNTEIQPIDAQSFQELNKIITSEVITHESINSNKEFPIKTTSHTQLNRETQPNVAKPLPELNNANPILPSTDLPSTSTTIQFVANNVNAIQAFKKRIPSEEWNIKTTTINPFDASSVTIATTTAAKVHNNDSIISVELQKDKNIPKKSTPPIKASPIDTWLPSNISTLQKNTSSYTAHVDPASLILSNNYQETALSSQTTLGPIRTVMDVSSSSQYPHKPIEPSNLQSVLKESTVSESTTVKLASEPNALEQLYSLTSQRNGNQPGNNNFATMIHSLINMALIMPKGSTPELVIERVMGGMSDPVMKNEGSLQPGKVVNKALENVFNHVITEDVALSTVAPSSTASKDAFPIPPPPPTPSKPPPPPPTEMNSNLHQQTVLSGFSQQTSNVPYTETNGALNSGYVSNNHWNGYIGGNEQHISNAQSSIPFSSNALLPSSYAYGQPDYLGGATNDNLGRSAFQASSFNSQNFNQNSGFINDGNNAIHGMTGPPTSTVHPDTVDKLIALLRGLKTATDPVISTPQPNGQSLNDIGNQNMEIMQTTLSPLNSLQALYGTNCRLLTQCGTDGFTYLSECMMPVNVSKACDGYCPCSSKRQSSLRSYIIARLKQRLEKQKAQQIYTTPAMMYFGEQTTALPTAVDVTQAQVAMCISRCPARVDHVCSARGVTHNNQCIMKCRRQKLMCLGPCPCEFEDIVPAMRRNMINVDEILPTGGAAIKPAAAPAKTKPKRRTKAVI